jgi:hypothetical protein
MTRFPRILLRASAALLILLLAACAGRAVKPQSAEDLVRERAKARWALMIARDFDAAYQFLTPGTRLLLTAEDFNEKFRHTRVDWKSAEVKEVVCSSADRCEAKVDVAFGISGGMRGVPNVGGNQLVTEIWLLEDGVWYYLLPS